MVLRITFNYFKETRNHEINILNFNTTQPFNNIYYIEVWLLASSFIFLNKKPKPYKVLRAGGISCLSNLLDLIQKQFNKHLQRKPILWSTSVIPALGGKGRRLTSAGPASAIQQLRGQSGLQETIFQKITKPITFLCFVSFKFLCQSLKQKLRQHSLSFFYSCKDRVSM